jgi:hypothetical protein
MKKIVALSMVLLLMFSFALIGCGGSEEPAASADPAVEEDVVVEEDAPVTRAELIAEYNVLAELFNEVEAILIEQGAYEGDPEIGNVMDDVYDYLGMAAVVLESEITEEETAAVYDEIHSKVIMLEQIRDAHM